MKLTPVPSTTRYLLLVRSPTDVLGVFGYLSRRVSLFNLGLTSVLVDLLKFKRELVTDDTQKIKEKVCTHFFRR